MSLREQILTDFRNSIQYCITHEDSINFDKTHISDTIFTIYSDYLAYLYALNKYGELSFWDYMECSEYLFYYSCWYEKKCQRN